MCAVKRLWSCQWKLYTVLPSSWSFSWSHNPGVMPNIYFTVNGSFFCVCTCWTINVENFCFFSDSRRVKREEFSCVEENDATNSSTRRRRHSQAFWHSPFTPTHISTFLSTLLVRLSTINYLLPPTPILFCTVPCGQYLTFIVIVGRRLLRSRRRSLLTYW